jgi:hypothetical protein
MRACICDASPVRPDGTCGWCGGKVLEERAAKALHAAAEEIRATKRRAEEHQRATEPDRPSPDKA